MVDSFRHQGMRKQLVEELKGKGIKDQNVLDAINKIPRHQFLDTAFVNFAYQDKAFPIGSGQTISQPFTVAIQSQLLEVKPNERILEVGTGSGYQAAVLSFLNAEVFTIERQRELFLRTKEFLPQLGYNCMFVYGCRGCCCSRCALLLVLLLQAVVLLFMLYTRFQPLLLLLLAAGGGAAAAAAGC